MPRGVAIPEIRQQLFAAAERVIAADGPSRLTGRAVTAEAGVATGLLHTHFRSFEGFLTAYAVDRSFQLAGELAGLPGQAGSGTVGGNLRAAAQALSGGTLRALTRLMVFHPGLTAEVEAVLGAGSAGVSALERPFATYLAAEQERGRIPAGADTGTLALAVVGTVHHLALTEQSLTRMEPLFSAV
ncbi:TetR/AcrR family transcriptional regulator [Actinoplanes sp. NBRC 101535]|uniref:TetR/AcrR family transcriptional regulator n=1 Tax=Actinoplanes sp. NBRC 101535 TaxID=3032196 RepID=UPI0024A23658|nr:TetR/AcrR family transcriptional regulator [Actinoplanes sp. NBRC 101535]GLY06891.1 hypothetical protein Acsp01_72700 [Actinoplanes sp. NBRC 101535]